MAQSDSTMVLKLEGNVVATATLNEDFQWSIDAKASDDIRNGEAEVLQDFTNQELEDLGPADGDPQAVLIQRAAETFGWEIKRINERLPRRGIAY